MIATPTNKRRFRVSLRTLLIAVTCVAITLGWFAHAAHRRKAAIAAIRRAGGNVLLGIREPSWLDRMFGPQLFANVPKVDLRQCKVDNELLAHVAVLKELRRLDLSGANIDDAGLRTIAHLPLQELWLQSTRISDASAPTLSQIKTLDFLQLNATAVSNTFLENLQRLPHLAKLGLRGTRVTGAGMKFLPRHPRLKELDLYSTEVDDAGVRRLVECRSLTDVGLSMTKITNRVFDYLDRLPNLTGADLSANRPITTEAVLEFEKSHPKCDIEWYGN